MKIYLRFFLLGLFVDVGNNYSVLDFTNISFIYDDIDERDPLNMNGNNPNELVLVNLPTPTSPHLLRNVEVTLTM